MFAARYRPYFSVGVSYGTEQLLYLKTNQLKEDRTNKQSQQTPEFLCGKDDPTVYSQQDRAENTASKRSELVLKNRATKK